MIEMHNWLHFIERRPSEIALTCKSRVSIGSSPVGLLHESNEELSSERCPLLPNTIMSETQKSSNIRETIPEVYPTSTPWTPIPLLKEESRVVRCENCGQSGPTELDHEPGLITWIGFCGLSLAGLVCGCCLIPFCLNKTKDVRHRCSSCHQVLARYERL